MPGSLFPRSESLIPDSPPTPEVQERRVGWLPRTPSPAPPTPKPTKKTLHPAPPKSEKAKGKERARDTSRELHVRGKERELSAAREAHARNDSGRDDEERERDKQRIRMLEDEIARLRAQVRAYCLLPTVSTPSELHCIAFRAKRHLICYESASTTTSASAHCQVVQGTLDS